MDEVVSELAAHLLERLAHTPSDRRLLVGVSGIPASGKSAIARHVCAKLNARAVDSSVASAVVVGMDGWHLPRTALDRMENAQEAKDRRGAEWTFDAKAFADFVVALRDPIHEASPPLLAPTFSHSTKDPVPDALSVLPNHRVILVEGLYANLSTGEWARAARCFDERWVCQVERDVARSRLVERHVATGVAADANKAAWRADNNDLPNGDFLLAHVLEPARRIPSVFQASWAGAE